MQVTVVGAGVFGLAAAWRMAARGHRVEVREAGTIPAEKASSRDISKAIRGGYGRATERYGPWLMRARELWRELELATGRTIYHQTGCLQLTSSYGPGGFEYEGAQALDAMGWPVTWLDAAEVGRRFPAFAPHDLAGGGLDAWGGWLDPLEALPALAAAATAAGAEIRTGTPVRDVRDVEADAVVVCVGPWVAQLLPALAPDVRTTVQHEAFFRPVTLGSCAHLPAWSLDMETQGWYGFPALDGMVKVARHVPDVDGDPEGGRGPDPRQSAMVERFVTDRIPGLAGAADEGRTCFYTMTRDGTFLFDRAPGEPSLFVAGCGGGHGFKFGPMLGEWAADLIDGVPVPVEFTLAGKGRDRVV